MGDIWTKHPLSDVSLEELARNLCAIAAWQEGLNLEQAMEALRSAEAAAYERAAKWLRAVEAHHAAMNEASGRPALNSHTLRIVRAALAGCEHIPGDVCRRCQPTAPICAEHPDAPLRRFGPLFRCSECGEPGTLTQGASLATKGGDR